MKDRLSLPLLGIDIHRFPAQISGRLNPLKRS